MHLFYPPKICIGIVSDYSWDIFVSQEKLQTMIMQNFWGVKEVHYGIVQVVNGAFDRKGLPGGGAFDNLVKYREL